MPIRPHEDRHTFAVWSPNMATAIMAINRTETLYLIEHIVPDRDGFWLIYKADSWARRRWEAHFPGAEILPKD